MANIVQNFKELFCFGPFLSYTPRVVKKFSVQLSIHRYTPDQGTLKQAPHLEIFLIEADDNTTVLDALQQVKDQQDGSVSYRWSCRMGICGSCGMIINGKPVLACSTYCKDVVKKGFIRIEPMRNMPILKDLIVDIDDPMEKMRSVMPYMDRVDVEEGVPSKQSKKQRERIDQTSQCIKCMLCYSACPVYGQEKDFVGPGAGALAYRYVADSRDNATGERLDQLVGEKNSVWGCSFVGECSVACPKRVDPAKALQRLKVMGSMRMVTKPLTDLLKKKK